MSKKERVNTYTQCLLTRTENDGAIKHQQMTWLPTQLTGIGKFVQLKSRATQEWEDTWKIEEKYSTKAAEYIEEHERDYLKHRKGSDI